MLGVANAQLGTAILGLGAAQGMLMSSTLNTSATWVSKNDFYRWTSSCSLKRKLSRRSRLLTSPNLLCRAQQEHRKRIPAQSSSLPIAISRPVSPSIEASAAAVSGNAGSSPRCAPPSAVAHTSARLHDSLPSSCQITTPALTSAAEGALALLSLLSQLCGSCTFLFCGHGADIN